MTFLLPLTRPALDLGISGRMVSLRAPAMSDYPAWADLRAQSRSRLEPFEPAWTHDELSKVAFRHRLKHYAREAAQDLGYAFFIFDAGGRTLLGAVTLSSVRRGVADAASVGYWIGAPYAGRGYMTAAVRLLAGWSFRSLKLHRLEAGCLPHNQASVRVLVKSGFRQEGLARSYLRINGVWRDHLLFARLADDPAPEEGA